MQYENIPTENVHLVMRVISYMWKQIVLNQIFFDCKATSVAFVKTDSVDSECLQHDTQLHTLKTMSSEIWKVMF